MNWMNRIAIALLSLPLLPAFAEEQPLSEATCSKLSSLYERYTSPISCAEIRTATPKKMGDRYQEDFRLYNEYCVTCDYARLLRPGYSDLDIVLRSIDDAKELTPEDREIIRSTYIRDIQGNGKSSNQSTAENVGGLWVSRENVPGDARVPLTPAALIAVGISEEDARLLTGNAISALGDTFQKLEINQSRMMEAMGAANAAITSNDNASKAPACLNLLKARHQFLNGPTTLASDKKKKSKKDADQEIVGLKKVSTLAWDAMIKSAFDGGCKTPLIKQWCAHLNDVERTACEIRYNALNGKDDAANEIVAAFKKHVGQKVATGTNRVTASEVVKPQPPQNLVPGAAPPPSGGEQKSGKIENRSP